MNERELNRYLERLAAAILAIQNRVQKKNGSPTKRKLRLSPQRRRQLKLHGTYLGTIRALPGLLLLKAKMIQKRRGYEAAIQFARKHNASR